MGKDTRYYNPNYGDIISFNLEIFNYGPDYANNVTVVDYVPEGLEVIESSLHMVVVMMQNIGQLHGFDIKEGNNARKWYSCIVKDYGEIINIAKLGNYTAIKAINVPEIVVNKTTPIDNPNYGDVFEYSVNVKNIGSVDANNFVVTDYLPSDVDVIVDNISDSGKYNPVNRTITWTVDLLAGDVKSLIYNVTVLGYGLITNNVTVGNHSANKTINVPYIIILNKTTPNGEYDFGDVVEYTIYLQNNGTGPAKNVAVYDVLPEGLDLNTTSMSPIDESNVTTRPIKWIIELKSGDYMAITYNCTANHLDNLTNVVYVGNETKNSTIYVCHCNLTINITAPEKVHTGDEFDIIVNVTNYGPDVAENVTAVLNITGAEISILDIYSNNGTNYTNGTWTIGNLPMGKSVILLLHVKAIQEGTILITGIVSSHTYNTNVLNNIDNATVIVEDYPTNPVPDYNINMLPTGNPLFVLLFVLLLTPL